MEIDPSFPKKVDISVLFAEQSLTIKTRVVEAQYWVAHFDARF